MAFTLPALPYAFNALEPHIDARTMEIHHGKHHNAYVTNLNNAITGKPEENLSIEEICKTVSKHPVAVRNNGGGHYNHSLFWTLLTPSGGGAPSGELADAIKSAFTSFDEFKTKFAAAAAGRFGSGWAWLGVANKKLVITSTPNQDNPLMKGSVDVPCDPVMGVDVWEHAYYLKYQNKRADYLAAWWGVVKWPEVEARFAKVM